MSLMQLHKPTSTHSTLHIMEGIMIIRKNSTQFNSMLKQTEIEQILHL